MYLRSLPERLLGGGSKLLGKIKDHFVIICFNITCLIPGGSLSWSGPSLIMVSLGFRGAATHTHTHTHTHTAALGSMRASGGSPWSPWQQP